MAPKYKGVDTSNLDVSMQLEKDLTPASVKVKRYLKSEGYWQILVILFFASFAIPSAMELLYIVGLFLAYRNIKSVETLPYKKPKSSNDTYDNNEINAGNGTFMKPDGITFFGNEIGTKKEVWFTNSDVRTHCLIFGTTGSGKTEALLSICINSLNQASGFLYIDGKGDNSLWAKVFSLCASRGRLDDLYLINYMTSSVNLDIKTTDRITNKMNPFATGNADSLTELIVSLLPDGGGGGDMWKGRAAVFMGALLKPLVYMRDEGKLLLDVDVIRKYFTLNEIIKLSRRTDIPKKYIDGIREYVKNLPGYVEPTPANPDPAQVESVAEQHGYISMQYTETFGLLADTYAHIMKTQVAEIDFYDIVVNRRILVVLLPALEKSKQSLSNLGRIIIASIKNMMSSTLGSKVEGMIEDVIETKPTNAPSPYLTIFDEYGYYATEGAAVMPAQARSLGFFMVFAGQDYQAFKKGSEEEAASIVANCAVKICMKLEDPTETLKIFQEAAGREKVIEQSSFEKDENAMTSSYGAAKNVSVGEKDIISGRDLRNQLAGEAHMLFMDTTRRVKMFYANPKLLKETRVNSFLEIEPPTYENVRLMKTGYNKINKKFREIMEDPKLYHQSIEKSMKHYSSSELDSVFKLLKVAKGQSNSIKSGFAIAGYIEKINIIDNKIISDIRGNIDKFNEIKEDKVEAPKVKETAKVKVKAFTEPKKESSPPPSQNKSVIKDDDIDSIFDNEEEDSADSTLRYVRKTLNSKYEELEYLDSQENSFDSFSRFEDVGLEIFTTQEQLNETEKKLQNKLFEKSVVDINDPAQQNKEHNSLTVEKNIIDLGLSSNKTTKKPKNDNKTDKKQMQKEVEDIISAYFD